MASIQKAKAAAPAPQARPEERVQCKCGEWFRKSAFEAHVITCAATPASGMALPPSCVVGAAPAETARPDTEHAASSEELAERFPKLFKPAEPEAVETAEQLAVDICRELYDRFVMGGWQPEEAHDYVRDILEAHAKQRVEQVERDAKRERDILREAANDLARLFESSERKVADLERERDRFGATIVKLDKALEFRQREAKSAESELREM